MGKVFCTGNQWFIGVWKDSKKTQVRFFSNDFMCINCIFIRNRYPSVGLEPPGRGLP